jgi:hypothetical protein
MITATWAGPPAAVCAMGEARRWTGGVVPALERALLAPQAVSSTMVQIAEICAALGRNCRIVQDTVL